MQNSRELTFGQIEELLAAGSGIAGHKRIAFAGRLKMLQKNGLPIGTRPGRGKAGTYTFPHLVQMAIGVQMLQIGISPSSAASMVAKSWPSICHSMAYVLWHAITESKDPEVLFGGLTDTVWLVRPREMADLTVDAASVFADVNAVEPSNMAIVGQTISRSPPTNLFDLALDGYCILPAERMILGLSDKLIRSKYLDFFEISAQVLEAEKAFNPDLKVALNEPPWGGAWTAFADTLVPNELIEARALEVIERMPSEMQGLLRRITPENVHSVWLEDKMLMAKFSCWGTVELLEDGQMRLNRLGRAIHARIAAEKRDVDS